MPSSKILKKRRKRGGFFKSSQLNFYQTCCSNNVTEAIKYKPLIDFERQYFYSRSNISLLARKKILFLMKHSNRYFVAINPIYKSKNPRQLLELVR